MLKRNMCAYVWIVLGSVMTYSRATILAAVETDYIIPLFIHAAADCARLKRPAFRIFVDYVARKLVNL